VVKIFVGYGYQTRDEWVEELVFPIIEAFGAEVVSGKEIFGQRLSTGVLRQIEKCDALIGFLTKREGHNSNGNTHRWVIEELAAAISHNIRVLEVREVGVTDQGGLAGDRQRIGYDEQKRDRCLVEIVKAIGLWHRTGDVKIQLLPRQFVDEIRPLLQQPGFRCSYNLIEGNNEVWDKEAKVVPITGGLFMSLKDVSLDALIQVQVAAQGISWRSDFEPIEQLRIHLSKD
jgi:hypothetical protein